MLSQRGPAKAPVAAGAPVKPRAEARAKSGPKRMTFKDRHALETLPARMAGLEAEVAKLTRFLEDPNLYSKNAARFNEVTGALNDARRALTLAEEQWLALELSREELEG